MGVIIKLGIAFKCECKLYTHPKKSFSNKLRVLFFFKKDGQFGVALVAYHMGPRLFLAFCCAILVMVPILKFTSWSSMAAGAPAIRLSIHLGRKKKRKMNRVCFSAEAALFKELSYKLYHIFTYPSC